MFRKIFNIPEYLHLNDVGFLELLFAFTPLLSGFSLGSIPLSVLMWVVLLVVCFIKRKGAFFQNYAPLTVFVVYWFIREFVDMFVDEVNINGLIAQIIYFLAFYALHNNMDFKKLIGSMNLVAIVAMLGLLYQWTIIVSGGFVHPLEIPGLTMPESRLEVHSIRPSSFFMEPAAFVAFMACPLSFALLEKKLPWAIVIIFFNFLTTSTTGLITSFIMLFVYLLQQGKNFKMIGLVGVVIAGLFFALTHSDAFSNGIDKLNDTDIETNVRLTQGRYVASTMESSEYVFGTPYSSSYNYCTKSGRAPNVVFYGESVYMPTFWLMLLLYGVVGLVLYLRIYLDVAKRSKAIWPLLAYLIPVMFSACINIGGMFIVTLIVLLQIVKNSEEPSL